MRTTGVSPRIIVLAQAPVSGGQALWPACTQPANRLSQAERQHVLQLANGEQYRDLCPKQIVPRLADEGLDVASESIFYRVLREHAQLQHRSRARPSTKRERPEHVASAPKQVWGRDITYLKGPVRGAFLYLYLVVDVYSRRVMGWQMHQEESTEKAASLIRS